MQYQAQALAIGFVGIDHVLHQILVVDVDFIQRGFQDDVLAIGLRRRPKRVHGKAPFFLEKLLPFPRRFGRQLEVDAK